MKFYYSATLRKSQWFHPWLRQGARVGDGTGHGTVCSAIYELPPEAQTNPGSTVGKPDFVVDVAVKCADAFLGYRIYDRVVVLSSRPPGPGSSRTYSCQIITFEGEHRFLVGPLKLGMKGMQLIGAEFDAKLEGHDGNKYTGRVTSYNMETGKYIAKFADGDSVEYSLSEIYEGKPRLPPNSQSAMPSLNQKKRFAPSGAVVADCPSEHGLTGFVVPLGPPFVCDVCETKCSTEAPCLAVARVIMIFALIVMRHHSS